MSKKQQRMETMNNAGIDTGKYFSFKLTEGLKPGASITLVIGDDGMPIMMNRTDSTCCDLIKEEIFANGYVKNTKLHRRWVMAHMFRMLNYKHWRGNESGYDAALRYWHGYDYQFKVIGDELKALSKLEVSDRECFEERVSFFDKEVVIATYVDYVDKLHNYIDGLKVKKCKGIPYKTIKGKDVFVANLNAKIYGKFRLHIRRMRDADNYAMMHKFHMDFMRDYICLPYDTKKCYEWKDSFKGSGAYYTLKNMIMYHNCKIVHPVTERFLSREESLMYLNEMRIKYKGEGWRMFALMKKVIRDNEFDFNKRMKEIN